MSALGMNIKPGNLLRVGYFTAGLAAGSAVYFSLRSEVWLGAASVARDGFGTLPPATPLEKEPFFGPKTK